MLSEQRKIATWHGKERNMMENKTKKHQSHFQSFWGVCYSCILKKENIFEWKVSTTRAIDFFCNILVVDFSSNTCNETIHSNIHHCFCYYHSINYILWFQILRFTSTGLNLAACPYRIRHVRIVQRKEATFKLSDWKNKNEEFRDKETFFHTPLVPVGHNSLLLFSIDFFSIHCSIHPSSFFSFPIEKKRIFLACSSTRKMQHQVLSKNWPVQ